MLPPVAHLVPPSLVPPSCLQDWQGQTRHRLYLNVSWWVTLLLWLGCAATEPFASTARRRTSGAGGWAVLHATPHTLRPSRPPC